MVRWFPQLSLLHQECHQVVPMGHIRWFDSYDPMWNVTSYWRKAFWHCFSCISGTSVRGSVSLKSGSFFGDGEDFQDWIMMIKHVQANDTGSYECQVTTDEGGILSHQVNATFFIWMDIMDGWPIPAAHWLCLNSMFSLIFVKKRLSWKWRPLRHSSWPTRNITLTQAPAFPWSAL